jgi:hypothetical protein
MQQCRLQANFLFGHDTSELVIDTPRELTPLVVISTVGLYTRISYQAFDRAVVVQTTYTQTTTTEQIHIGAANRLRLRFLMPNVTNGFVYLQIAEHSLPLFRLDWISLFVTPTFLVMNGPYHIHAAIVGNETMPLGWISKTYAVADRSTAPCIPVLTDETPSQTDILQLTPRESGYWDVKTRMIYIDTEWLTRCVVKQFMDTEGEPLVLSQNTEQLLNITCQQPLTTTEHTLRWSLPTWMND